MIEASAYPRVTKPGVTIGTHAHPSEIRVELGRGGRLVGRVRHDGPFPPGEIYLRGVPESKDAAPLRARCGADGALDVDGLAAGGWRIWAEVQEPETPPSMTSRPHSLDLEVGKTATIELRLLPIQRATFRVSGLFPDGDPPTTDKSSPAYGDIVRRFGEFRLRCRDGADACWIDAGLDTFPYQIVDRDVIFHLPLPEGDYLLALDHGDDEIASRRLRSPGVTEAVVPAK
jgi:hypothetical protein